MSENISNMSEEEARTLDPNFKEEEFHEIFENHVSDDEHLNGTRDESSKIFYLLVN